MLMSKSWLLVLGCLCLIGFFSYTTKDCYFGSGDEIIVDRMPQLLTRVDAFYPPLARTAGIEGIVGVKFSIDTTGRVVDAEIERASGSNAGFEEVSIESGKENLWIPAYSQGRPVPYWGYYETIFISHWTGADTGRPDTSESQAREQIQRIIADSAIEIHEVYDTPPTIQTTQVVEYFGEQSPKDDTGSLWIRAVIDDSGMVRHVVVIQSSLVNPKLKDALVRAFYSYDFKPATRGETAVATQVECQIVFAPRAEVIRCY